MKVLTRSLIAAAIAAACSQPLLAHHSGAAFDSTREVTVTGTITEYSFRNPHVYMTLEVKKADGSVVATEVEAGAGSVIGPLGFDRNAVKVGDVVSIVGNPGRRDPDALLMGKELYKEDGSYLPLHIGSRSIAGEVTETATSIAGTWFSPRTSFFAILGGSNGWKLTEKGTQAKASSAGAATPQKDCIPIGEPGLMFYPVANTITVHEDRVEMKIDWLDSERTIWLDGRAHPAATETSLHGHSVGQWDGKALVVDTTNFSVNPIGLSTSLPNSTGKHMTERFEVSADGKNMVYSGTLEDPEYLAEAVQWSGTWEYRPDMQQSNESCDLETARKFLND